MVRPLGLTIGVVYSRFTIVIFFLGAHCSEWDPRRTERHERVSGGGGPAYIRTVRVMVFPRALPPYCATSSQQRTLKGCVDLFRKRPGLVMG